LISVTWSHFCLNSIATDIVRSEAEKRITTNYTTHTITAWEIAMGLKTKRSAARKHGVDSCSEIANLEDLPNVGPAIAADFRKLGIATPSELVGRDPFALYDDLCRVTGVRHDPCVLDVFISAVRYMEGSPKRPWWKYTAERKRSLASKETGTALGSLSGNTRKK
jgi:hypothetical protein